MKSREALSLDLNEEEFNRFYNLALERAENLFFMFADTDTAKHFSPADLDFARFF